MKNNYPVQYIKAMTLADGTIVVARPMHPCDAKKATAFRASLTDDSLMARFLGFIPKVTKQLVKQLVTVDYKTEMAIVTEITTDSKTVAGVGRIAVDPATPNAVELAVIVVDAFQGQGLGTQLIEYMLYIAKDMGYTTVTAMLSSSNEKVIKMIDALGFTKVQQLDGTIKAHIALEDS